MNDQRRIRWMLCICLFCMSFVFLQAATLRKEDFKAKSEKERIVGHTVTGSWNRGEFFETVTCELVGFDDEAMTMKYRFRYYITHKGPGTSYIHQKVPVGVILDNRNIATFTSWIGVRISNTTQLCGEKTVTLKPGNHTVELRDMKAGAITIVNVKKRIYIPMPTYTVTFLDSDGTLLKSQKVERYASASAPVVKNTTSAAFIGWDIPFHNVRKDLVVTAQYATKQFQVNFLDWDGKVLKSQGVAYGKDAAPPSDPYREGYVFQGWDGSYTNVRGNRNIFAQYQVRSFAVSFDSNGGSSVEPQTVSYGDVAQRPLHPVKAHHAFLGWYRADGAPYDFRTPVKSSITLYAHWDEEPTITASDLHIFADMYDSEEWEKQRVAQAEANDKEDGNLRDKLRVIADTTNVKKPGTYSLVYQVKDRAGNVVQKRIRVFVLDKRPSEERVRTYVRSISKEYIETLYPNSYWRESERWDHLMQTLQKEKGNALCTWRLQKQDIERMKQFHKEHAYSQKSNAQFLKQFWHLRRTP